MSFTAYANVEMYEYLGLKTVKGNPCYLTNGQFTESSINFMVSAYGDFKEKSHIILTVIEVALDAGCDIDLPNEVGLSPLNNAILFNEPKLVSFLLNQGANPRKRIKSDKQLLNGLDSYHFLELIESKDPKRYEIISILENHKQRA